MTFKGKFYSIKFRDMEPVDGIILDYKDDWMLLQSNAIDYVLDGYIIVNRKAMNGLSRGDDEKWAEKVIKKKYRRLRKAPIVPLDNMEVILKSLTKKYGVFTIYTKEKNICWLGRLISIDSKTVVIDFLTTRAKWHGPQSFKRSEIRKIGFDTDYINSLKLMMIRKTLQNKS